MKLTLGISPCPNDTFMFDALIHNKIDTLGLDFDVIFKDIQELNTSAMQSKLDVTKASFYAFTHCVESYILLDSGSALGTNCGPLFIKKPSKNISSESKIAIPGRYTTANMLFDIVYPDYNNKTEIIFSEIERSIQNEKVDAGVIIHENRFTYLDNGLEKVRDLGEFWFQQTGLPLPLGGIIIKRKIPREIQRKVQDVLKESIKYAFKNPQSSREFVRCYAQEMKQEVIDSHIKLYVNDFSISLSKKGREAVNYIFDVLDKSTEDIFV